MYFLRRQGDFTMDTRKINMKDLIASHFQYGMTMEGIVSVNEGDWIQYMVNPLCLTLIYNCKLGSSRELLKQQISLAWLSRHYGSKRVYLLCPVCGKRCMILYNSVAAYVCRECDKLANKGCQNDWEAQARYLCFDYM